MTEEEFWVELRKMVKQEVAAYFASVPSLQEPEELVGTAGLCKELGISKQTLYNWLKHPKSKPFITGNRQKVGSKVRYNVTAIKAAIKKFPAFFGGGRGYAFRDKVTLTGEQKATRRFKHIDLMLLCGEVVSESDRSWHVTEKQQCAEGVKDPGLDDSPIK